MKKMMMGFAGALSLAAANSAAYAAEALQTFELDEIPKKSGLKNTGLGRWLLWPLFPLLWLFLPFAVKAVGPEPEPQTNLRFQSEIQV